MIYSGMNLVNLRTMNRSKFLKLLNDRGPMPRKDISAELGLTPAAVTQICSELLEEGVLEEGGALEEEARVGRKKILIGLNYRYAYILGVCIESEDTTVFIGNLRGECLRRRVLKTDSGTEPENFLRQVADTLRQLQRDAGMNDRQFLGIGVSVPGPVARQAGISEHAYRIWNEPVKIADFFRKQTDLPVIVENNVKAFAEAELIFGAGKEVSNILLVKWGPGVESAIVISKRVYDNQKGDTSELGHVHISGKNKLCRCGRRGCLETEVSTHAVAEKVRDSCTESRMPMVWNFCHGAPERLQARNIRTWADIPDSGLRKVLDKVIEKMADVTLNAERLLAPDRVICFGDLFRLSYFKQKFPEFYRKLDITYEEGSLEYSRLSSRTDYIGPLALVFNEILLQDR